MSAYQDKIVDHSDPVYKKFADRIVQNFGSVNFGNFVQMILKDMRGRCRDLTDCKVDVHWKPFISRCGFCDVPYKVIAKAETFAEDQKFIGKLANVDFATIGKLPLRYNPL